MKYYLQAFQNYANIKGRMARHEFWQFMLFNFVFWILALVVDSLLSLHFITFLYRIVLLAPTLSAMARRLHDTGKSGKWVILLFGMAVFGLILAMATVTDANVGYKKYAYVSLLFLFVSLSIFGVLIYKLSIAGEKGANKYGPDPMGVKMEEGD